jgi:hypothetical protein
MRRILILASLVLALGGCGSFSFDGDERSPYFVVPRDSRVVLAQALTIAGGEVAVYLQDGRVMPFAKVRKYYPHCKFELYTLSAPPRTVAPDEFTVIRSLQEETHSAAAGLIRLARRMGAAMGDAESGGRPLVSFTTRLYLRSAQQPDVFRLSCAQWGYPPQDRHVTIAEMRQTLGGVITLKLAGH